MKVLVIPDVHLKTWVFDRAEDILKDGKADRAVCLMDLADDWNMGFQIGMYEAVYDRAIEFANTFPDTLWCYGNHDVSYPWGRLESGYSPYAERTVISKLEKLRRSLRHESQIGIMHRIDHVLFTHGGLSTEFVRWLDRDLLDAEIDDVIRAVNNASEDALWRDLSPLWLRPQFDGVEAFRGSEYVQAVGHTPVEKILEKDGFISTDVFSTTSTGYQIGESAMIVIDSETKKYKKISVPRKPDESDDEREVR